MSTVTQFLCHSSGSQIARCVIRGFFEGRARLGTLPEEYPPFPKSGKDGPLALRYIFRRERMGKLATDRRYSVCLL